MPCPEGHDLPNRTPAGECTPLYCAVPPPNAPPVTAIVPVEEREDGVEYAEKLEQRHLQKALVREALRDKQLKVPKGLKGAAAEAFVDAHLTELSVLAAKEYERALRFGDDSQRMKAAQAVLAATGHGPKESSSSGGALIVIQGDASVALAPPWRRQGNRKPAQVIDVEAKDVKEVEHA